MEDCSLQSLVIMMINKGKLFVVSAPSGCGKGTILSEVLKNNDNLFYSVSATTRSPRDGELDGVNYYFLSLEEFKREIENGGMLEYAQFCDNYYGTPKQKVLEKLNQGIDVILEIETNGAMQIKKAMKEAILIFILPPSVSELRRRLNKRGTEEQDIIDKRVNEAVAEIKKAREYDYIMMNDELEKAIEDFEAILKASKLTNENNKNMIEEVLENA